MLHCVFRFQISFFFLLYDREIFSCFFFLFTLITRFRMLVKFEILQQGPRRFSNFLTLNFFYRSNSNAYLNNQRNLLPTLLLTGKKKNKIRNTMLQKFAYTSCIYMTL